MPIALAAFAVAVAAFCLFRLFLVKREVRGLARQLRRYNDGASSAKVLITGPDRDLEALAAL